MNSVTSAQLQPSSARADTCACTRAPSQQADAFVVARLLRLRNRTRCSSCWVPWVFWVRGDKWRVSSSRPSRLRMYLSRRPSLSRSLVVVVIPLQFSSVTTPPFSDCDPSLVTSLHHRAKNITRVIFYRLTSRVTFCRFHFIFFRARKSSAANHGTRKHVWFMRGKDETRSLSHKDPGGS